MGKRPPGRPPLDATDQSVQVCVTMPSRKYDTLYEKARQERVTVAEFIRRQLDDAQKKTSPK